MCNHNLQGNSFNLYLVAYFRHSPISHLDTKLHKNEDDSRQFWNIFFHEKLHVYAEKL